MLIDLKGILWKLVGYWGLHSPCFVLKSGRLFVDKWKVADTVFLKICIMKNGRSE